MLVGACESVELFLIVLSYCTIFLIRTNVLDVHVSDVFYLNFKINEDGFADYRKVAKRNI